MNVHKLLEKIDDIKQKLTDQEYKEIVEQLQPKHTEHRHEIYKVTCVYPMVTAISSQGLNVFNVGDEYEHRIMYIPICDGNINLIQNRIRNLGICDIQDITNLLQPCTQQVSFVCNDGDLGQVDEYDCKSIVKINVNPIIIKVEKYTGTPNH